MNNEIDKSVLLSLDMQKSNKREDIISAVDKLFYDNGYNSTGINEIISKANIAKATLYHHFESKEEICIAYLENRHKKFMVSFLDATKSRPVGHDRLLVIFDDLREQFRDKGFRGCWNQKMLGEISLKDEKIMQLLRQQKKDLIRFLEVLTDENIDQLSRAQIEKISHGIYLLYESAITESYLHQSDWPIYMAKNMASTLIIKSY